MFSSRPPNGHASTQLKPWEEIGYRGFSAFLASDNDFLIFRRFGSLNARLLLYLQDEISVLEADLEDLEAKYVVDGAKDIHNGSFRQEALPERTALLATLNIKVRQYNELLIQHSTLRARPHVPKRNITSIANWFYNTQNAIWKDEAAYIKQENDLIQLVPKTATPLRHFLEKSTHFRLSKLWKKDPPPLPVHSTHPETLHYSSDARIDNFIGITITALGMGMLIAPLWALAYVGGMKKRLCIVTGFIVLFLGLLAFTTVAKPFESLAAAAAYSAVLAVFLQSAS
ncbi:uncharacterized protein K460DRAFT_412737 [Cucurbitaria berberidis CBS 394.84]|uniref:DUF6594 domain-containing protein n=1 Tax=Cucurbitaria berberidis CBS 394.84 TaxID=1168544 RepID=A0A9P4GU70_9PLEO|nr:uncharacterized protein K460DRAFT_412737 [Cucurbitaria berberidis CBS 394.84]KAF1851126.1 hypothetical protein K460DRAFT_412737 [Cucurbitaria berberidis CBS 394.84]